MEYLLLEPQRWATLVVLPISTAAWRAIVLAIHPPLPTTVLALESSCDGFVALGFPLAGGLGGTGGGGGGSMLKGVAVSWVSSGGVAGVDAVFGGSVGSLGIWAGSTAVAAASTLAWLW